MSISDVVFWILAAVILGSGLAVVMVRNLVHAAFFLVLTFFGVSGLYVLLEADFLAIVQILIYVGAIAILIIFGVMLIQREDMRETNVFSSYKKVAGVTVALFLAILLASIKYTPLATAVQPPLESTVGPIADLMFTSFVVPFEAAGVLLLVAILGAIVLSTGVGREND